MVLRNSGTLLRTGAGCTGATLTGTAEIVSDLGGSGLTVALRSGAVELTSLKLSSQEDHGVSSRMSTRRALARISGLGFSPVAGVTLPMEIALAGRSSMPCCCTRYRITASTRSRASSRLDRSLPRISAKPCSSTTGFEVDGFRFHEPVAVTTREALGEPRFGIARSCFGAAGAGARLAHPQIEA